MSMGPCHIAFPSQNNSAVPGAPSMNNLLPVTSSMGGAHPQVPSPTTQPPYSYTTGGYDYGRSMPPVCSPRVVHPQPAQQSASPARAPHPIHQFVLHQEVQVHIRANVWVVGVIVSVLQLCHKFMGWGYEVEYIVPETGRVTVEQFPLNQMRP
ncbi:hypothetical protein BV25DRAFT_1989345 [Artomyces pyxidatus]|uniref:Uncharacterized protein n=1 Tax=Artomyces pyxidatus TaxID=48021 RepID=A0ACB8T8H8_9AGAM|nr:hypothetical protein BV25DRAFT_1989345 [Artomyces pyxidatus]